MAGFVKIPGLSPDLDRVQANVQAALAAIPTPDGFNAVSVSKDYKATGAEGVLHVDASRGNVRITLPATSAGNPPLTIQQVNKSGTFGTVTIVAAKAAKTISGANSIALDASGTGSVTLTCDGVSWWPSSGGALVPQPSPNQPIPPQSGAGVLTTKPPLLGGGPMSKNVTLELQPATEAQDGYLSASDKIIIDNLATTFPPIGRLINTTAPLTGGGALTADLTLAISANGIDGSLFRQSAAASLVGNPSGSTADVSDITLGAGLAFSGSTLVNTAPADHMVSIDGSDTTADYLAAKLTATAPVTLTVSGGAPSAPPSTGLKLWLKSTAGVTLSGSDVTAWADQSGNGFDAVVGAATAPTFNASSINGIPGITFGAANTVQLNNTTANPVSAGAARSIFVVMKPGSATAALAQTPFTLFRSAVGPSTPGVFCCSLMANAGTNYYFTDGYVRAYQATQPSYANTALEAEWLAAAVGASAALTYNVDGTTLSSPTNFFDNTDGGASGFTIGNREDNGGPSLNQQFVGDICEILVYDHVVTGSDLATLRGYLQAKYAITIAGAGGGGGAETLQISLVASASTLLGNPTGSSGAVGEITLGAGLSFSGSTLGVTFPTLYYQTVYDPTVGAQPQRSNLAFGEMDGTLVTTDDPTNDWTNVELATVPGNPMTVGGSTSLLTEVVTNPYGQVELVNAIGIDSTLAVVSSNLGRAAITGDVTISAGSNTAALANIPNDTTMAGDLLATQMAAPSTPASGHGRIWFDSTTKNFIGINEGAIKSAMVQARTAVTSQFVTGFGLGGSLTAAQPAFTDITGQATLAQLPSIGANTLLGNPTGSGAAPAAIALGTTSGVLQYVHGSPDTFAAYAAGTSHIPFGSGTAGGLTDDAHMQFSGVTFGLTSLKELQIYNDSATASALAGFRLGTDSAFASSFSFSMIGPSWSSGGGLVAKQILAELNAGAVPLLFSNFAGSSGADINFATGGSRAVKLAVLGTPSAFGTTVAVKGGALQVGDGTAAAAAYGVATSSAGFAYSVFKDATFAIGGALGNSVPGSNPPTSDLIFSTLASGTWTERMRIANGGNASIAGALVVNQDLTGLATNVMLLCDPAHASDRDRVQLYVGGGTIFDTPDNTYFAINPVGTNNLGVISGGIFSTARIGAATYSSGSAGVTELTSLYIDDAPTPGGVSAALYALHVGAGATRFGGSLRADSTVRLSAITGPAVLQVDGSGNVSVASGGLCRNVSYYVSSINPISPNFGYLLTSSPSTVTSGATLYPLGVAAKSVRLYVSVTANTIPGGGLLHWDVYMNGTLQTTVSALSNVSAGTLIDTGLYTTLGTTATTDLWGVHVFGTGTATGGISFTAELLVGY